MAKRRLKAEDVDVPTTADDVPGGYACELVSFNHEIGHVQFSIYAPIMPSPRPRVTTRGTFMPSDYRAHTRKLGITMGHIRGLLDARGGWDASARFNVSLFFEAFNRPTGDLDNLAKTILDAGQLHRGEPSGAELWTNDSQIDGLMVFRCRGAGTEHWSDTRVVIARIA